MDGLIYAVGLALFIVVMDLILLFAFKHMVMAYVGKKEGSHKSDVPSKLVIHHK